MTWLPKHINVRTWFTVHSFHITLIFSFVHTWFMSGLWWNIIQLFGRFIPYKILKPLNKFRDDSQKNLPGFRKFTYKDRLQRLHLPSLELRCLYVDLVWCYKILFGIVDIQAEDFFVPSTYAPTWGHHYKLFTKPHLSRTRANFFSERISPRHCWF